MNMEKEVTTIKELLFKKDKKIQELSLFYDEKFPIAIEKFRNKVEKIDREVSNFCKWYLDPIETKTQQTMAFCSKVDEEILNRLAAIEGHLTNSSEIESKKESVDKEVDKSDARLLQAFSYTVFDTILFSITQGAAPDFLLICQSALFETVYVNISRGFESYLFHEVPKSAIAVILQGRSILNELREREDRFLDESDLWETYAPEIQKWWVNTALPIIFGERDPDWDAIAFPTHEEMKTWTEGEFSQRKHFPAVADLVELAKERAVDVSDTFNFKILLAA